MSELNSSFGIDYCITLKKIEELLSKIKNESADNNAKINEVCFAFITLKNELFLLEKRINQDVEYKFQNVQIREIKKAVREQLYKEKRVIKEELLKAILMQAKELLQKEGKTASENEQIVWKNNTENEHLKYDLNNYKQEEEHQKDILGNSQANYLGETLDLEQTSSKSKEEKNYLTEIDTLNNKLSVIQQDNDCKFDDLETKLWNKLSDLENELTELTKNTNDKKLEFNEKLIQSETKTILEIEALKKQTSEQIEKVHSDINKMSDDFHKQSSNIGDNLQEIEENNIKKVEDNQCLKTPDSIQEPMKSLDIESDIKCLQLQLENNTQIVSQFQTNQLNNEQKISSFRKEIDIIRTEVVNLNLQVNGLYCHNTYTPLHLASGTIALPTNRNSTFGVPVTSSSVNYIYVNSVDSQRFPHLSKGFETSLNVTHYLNTINENGYSPLYFCVLNNNLLHLKSLLEYRPLINTRTKLGVTPLIESVGKSYAILSTLLDRGADPNIAIKDGLAALHFAVVNNNIAAVKILLKFKADTNAAIKDTITPLNLANQLLYTEIADELRNNGAIINNTSSEADQFINNVINILAYTNENLYLKKFALHVLHKYSLLPANRDIIHSSEVIPILLNHFEYSLDDDDIMQIFWDIVVNLTVSSPVNSKIFMDNNGLRYFSKCLSFKTYMPSVLITMVNIAEVKSCQYQFKNESLITQLVEICRLKKENAITLKYKPKISNYFYCEYTVWIVKFFTLLLSDGPDAWSMSDPTYKDVLDSTENVINKLPISLDYSYDYNHLDNVFEILDQCDIYQVQHFSAWSLLHLITVSPDKCYNLFEKTNGFSKISEMANDNKTHPKVKNKLYEIICLYCKHKNARKE